MVVIKVYRLIISEHRPCSETGVNCLAENIYIQTISILKCKILGEVIIVFAWLVKTFVSFWCFKNNNLQKIPLINRLVGQKFKSKESFQKKQ